jgi:hypothetical protein
MQFIQMRYKQFEENQERNESLNEDESSESKITLTEEQIKKFDLQVNVN